MANFKKMYDWVYSTDPEKATNANLNNPYWMPTQDLTYEVGKKYYIAKDNVTNYIIYTYDENNDIGIVSYYKDNTLL
jgi:hypothetical protein